MALFEGLAAVVAEVAGAGAVTQVAAGLGIAVAGVTGAGAAGALPTVVQDPLAAVAETVTPFDLPDSGVGTPDQGRGDAPGTGDSVGDGDDDGRGHHQRGRQDDASRAAEEASEEAAEEAREDADRADD